MDIGCTEAGAALNGPSMLDFTVNGRPLRREGMPNSNRNQFPHMAPHGIYPCEGDDEWIGISVRDNAEWANFGVVTTATFASDPRFATLEGRLAHENELDGLMGQWTATQEKHQLATTLKSAGIPAEPVRKPEERIDQDPNTEGFGLWPTVHHTEMGDVRVDGMPVHLSRTDWSMERGAACLGEHNDFVLGELLGYSPEERDAMRTEGVL